MKVTVDGIEVEVPAGANVLQACELAGKEIPRFCYHERLSVAGNCRMCLVEIEKAPPKPFASCAYPAADGMVVHTDSPMVKKARRGVMEFLLINHPLDCPICDQGGECDLQDQAMGYGSDHTRYHENKRAVQDKYLGPLVKTVMNRCIHCTRCIRFSTEIAGVSELGATSRGEGMEVGTYIEKALSSELSGNLIDICPVGALTSKPYAFVARPWELSKTDSVDVLDAVGASIRVDSRGPEVLRVLPRINEDVNEEWLADKSRFAIDGLKRRRLDSCWVKRDGRPMKATWDEAFAAIAARLEGLPGERIGAIAGDLCDAESMLALKDVMTALGSANLDCRQDGAAIDASRRDFYVFNTSIAGIEEADALLIVGSNPRREAPLVNARIRKRTLAGPFPVAAVGARADLTYHVEWLGELARGARFGGVHRDVEGREEADAAAGAGRAGAAGRCRDPCRLLEAGGGDRNAAARIGTASTCCTPRPAGWARSTWASCPGPAARRWPACFVAASTCCGCSAPTSSTRRRSAPDTFVVYQGHHGDRGAARADVILPGAAYTEKYGTYVNTEGRVQRGELRGVCARRGTRGLDHPARLQRGDRQDAAVRLRSAALRARMEQVNPVFARIDILPRFGCADTAGPEAGAVPLRDVGFTRAVANYYQTDPISRASPTMAECTATQMPAVARAAE